MPDHAAHFDLSATLFALINKRGKASLADFLVNPVGLNVEPERKGCHGLSVQTYLTSDLVAGRILQPAGIATFSLVSSLIISRQ